MFREALALEEHQSEVITKQSKVEELPMVKQTNTVDLLNYEEKISVFNKTIMTVLFAVNLCSTNCSAEVLP